MKKLNVLVIEDSRDDFELLVKMLEKLPYAVSAHMVETAEATRDFLASQPVQLVISDHRMPGFDSGEALEIFRSFDLDVPFVIYSDVIGEEFAVEAMHAGATDYVLKRNPARLLPAIERDLREAARRRERRSLEEKLRLTHRLFESVFTSPLMGLQFHDLAGNILEANQKFLDIVGFDRAALQAGKLNWAFITAPDFHAQDARLLEQLHQTGRTPPTRKDLVRRDGARIPVMYASAKVDHPAFQYVTYTIEVVGE